MCIYTCYIHYKYRNNFEDEVVVENIGQRIIPFQNVFYNVRPKNAVHYDIILYYII